MEDLFEGGGWGGGRIFHERLLAVYNSSGSSAQQQETSITDIVVGVGKEDGSKDDGGKGNQFSQRIFDCLVGLG